MRLGGRPGVLLAALLIAVTVTADAGAQAGEGAVAGRVVDESGTPLAGVCVGANNPSLGATVKSGTDGTYRIDALPAGSFKVAFHRCSDDSRNLLLQFYRDKPTYAAADPVTVSAGTTTSGIDAQMHPGGIIAGRVTTSNGTPIEDACVTAYRGDQRDSAVTDTTGAYQVSALPSGTYKVQFRGCSGPGSEFYSHKVDEQSADAISVTAPATTGSIDGIVPGGAITGRVLDDVSRQPVAGSCVSATGPDGQVHYTNTPTMASGRYTLSGLTPGSHRVRFEADRRLVGDVLFGCYSTANYFGEWFEDEVSSAAADPVTVSDGTTAGPLDGALAKAGSIAGTVRDTSGRPVNDLCVHVTDARGDTTEARTGPRGTYVAILLPAGAYKITFSPEVGCTPGFVIHPQPKPPTHEPSYWDGKASAATADTLQLGRGQDTTGIDGTVKPRATTNPNPLPVPSLAAERPPVVTAATDPPEIAGSARTLLVRVAPGGAFTLPRQLVDCTGAGPACKVRATVRVRALSFSARGPLRAIGGSRFTVRAGRRARIRGRLTRAGRRLLRRRGVLRARVRVKVVRGTTRASKNLRVTLRRRR